MAPAWCSLLRLSSRQRSVLYSDANRGNRRDDQDYQNQRARPCLPVPFVEGRDGIGKDLQRQGCRRLVRLPIPVLVSKCGEQQRRGFSGNAREGQHDAGDDSRGSRAQRNRERGAPAGDAQTVRGFADSLWDQEQHLLGGPRDGRNHHNGERNATGQRREMFLREHDQPVGHNADHDGGHTVQDIGDKAHNIAIAVSPVLGKKNARADPERDAEQTGDRKNDHRADDGIRHAAAGLTHRLRSLGQERKIDRADALINQIGKDGEERHQHDDDGERGNAGHRAVDYTPPQADGRNTDVRNQDRCRLGVHIRHVMSGMLCQAMLLAGCPRVTLHTMSRASALTTIVTKNSAKPISIKAERYRSPVASVNSLASTLAMVYPGANSDLAISGRLPITIVTAIVSPSARPKPKMIAPTMPARALRSTPMRIISQRVAPNASAASRWCCGMTVSTSRVIDEMIGMIMIARITPAASMPMP